MTSKRMHVWWRAGLAMGTVPLLVAALAAPLPAEAINAVTPAAVASTTSPWTIVPSPSPDPTEALSSVSCVSQSFCMAVGYGETGSTTHGSIQQWDGDSWNVVDAADPGGVGSAEFAGVSCVSSQFCMAVGGQGSADDNTFESVAEQWNGTGWSVVPMPASMSGQHNVPAAVSCASATSCTAAGEITANQSTSTLIESWNGTDWSVISSPNSSGVTNELLAVSCTASDSCTAVGHHRVTGGVFQTLAETSVGGGAWTISAPIDTSTTAVNELLGVSCLSSTGCRAVGRAFNATTSTYRPLAESFNGTTWSITTTKPFGTDLQSISCTSTTACTAAGGDGLIEAWNGSTWTPTPTPRTTDTERELNSVSCITSTLCTGVGHFLVHPTATSTAFRNFVEQNCHDTTGLADGAWKAAGCFFQPDSSDDDATELSSLDGLLVTPDSDSTVDYATDDKTVTSTGASHVALDLTALAGATAAASVYTGPLDLNLSGAPVTLPLAASAQIAGIKLSGALQLTPSAGGMVTGTATAQLPSILGDGTGHLSLTSTLAGGVSAVKVTASSGSFAKLYGLEKITLEFARGTWTVTATATTPTGAHRTLTGSLTYNAAGVLTGGGLKLTDISLGGLVTINSLSVSFSTAKGWTGAAALTQGTQKATVALTFDSAGHLTAGSFHASGVTLFKVFDLKTFDLDYAAKTSTWKLSITVAHEASGASASAMFSESDGAVQGVDLDIKNIQFLRKVTLNELDLSYEKTDDGHTKYSASADVELPGAVVTGVEGQLGFTDGVFTHGKLTLHGNVPIFEVAFLNTLGAEITIAPDEEISGSVGLSAGPKIDGKTLLQLDGKLAYKFPKHPSESGVYTLSGKVSALDRTIGEGELTVDSDTAALKLSLGESDKGFALGRRAHLVGHVTGHLVRHSFTARGEIKLTLDIGGRTREASANATLSNRGIVVCGKFPAFASGETGVAEEWGHAPVIKRGDCAPANF
jgi:hypothetical protein